MSKNISTQPLSGYMELLPQEQRVFTQMMDTIRTVYEENGFIPMDQPVVDRTESLLSNVGGDTTKELIRIARDDDKELALRFDLTVPLARYVANNYGELTFPFRRYAIGKVYRGERPQAGRFREFYQCDVDIIGNETLSIGYDADIILLMARVLERLDIGPFQIRINNRKLMNGLFESLGIENKTEVLRVLDKKEKISQEELQSQLQACEITEDATNTLIEFVESTSLEELPALDNELFRQGVAELSQVFAIAQASGIDSSVFVWDPSIARGLDYYTGTVFETRLLENPEIGSVCSGGRYDDLASAYTSRALPGVGTSIGLTRLFDQLMKKEVIAPSKQQTASQVLIIPLDDDLAPALSLQQSLLEARVPCEVSFAQGKLDKRIKYADKLGIPYIVLIGEQEIASGTYTLRNMQTGEEQSLTPEQITALLS